MFRNFQAIYTLVIADLVISTFLILLFQENIIIALTINLTIRPILILIISIFSFWVCGKLKISDANVETLVSFIISYTMINCLIFALKSNGKGFIETITDIHKNWTLFSFLMFPIIISYFILILTKAIWK